MNFLDSERYRKVRNQNENRKWFCLSDIISETQQLLWYKKYLSTEDEYMFSIFDKKNNYIGGCGLYHIDREKRSAEFGRIVIDKNMQRNGYGYQVILAVIKIAKEYIGIRTLFLTVKRENIPAIKIYKKAEFQIMPDNDAKDELIMMERGL